MDECKYDHLFASILDEERQIYSFLDAVFGFLWRRSDFFTVQEEGGKIGFPVGVPEELVSSILKKWQNLDRREIATPSKIKDKHETEFPECVSTKKVVATKENLSCPSTTKNRKEANSSDAYNGADRGTYAWTQTISDLEVKIPVRSHVLKGKDAKVTLTERRITVETIDESNRSKWDVLLDGETCYKLDQEESMWSLISGHHIMLYLGKTQERWWDGLVKDEPKIDTKKLDCSRPMSDLSDAEQMKIQELIWKEDRKKRGLKTDEQEKAERMLKDAWNAEGSPFKGTEFDPTVLDFNASSTMSIKDNT